MKIDKVLLETFKAKESDMKGQYDCSVCVVADNEVYEVSFKTQASAMAINIERNVGHYWNPHDYYVNELPRAQVVLPVVVEYDRVANEQCFLKMEKMEAIKK